jgi:hypothetical protein
MMVRPGPKTSQTKVRAEIIKLLGNNPDGLNFNKIFHELKPKGVFGSYSVLARALQELTRTFVISVQEHNENKIPTRTYKLTDPKMKAFTESYVEAKRKESIPIEKVILNESFLKSMFFRHVNNLITAYRSIFGDGNPTSEDASWRLFLSYENNYINNFMETISKVVSENKISIDEANKVAGQLQVDLLNSL